MKDLKFNMKIAIDFALRDAKTNTIERKYQVCDAVPKEINDYLKNELNFVFKEASCNSICDAIFSDYIKDDLVITLVWNGWTGYVAVSGHKLNDQTEVES